jgi:ElaB/YqjD/DUF883 family membrane-anchored ribosome-binding protein
MINSKQLLREEIYLYNRKKLLSEHSLLLINDTYYVKSILGIDSNLYEDNRFEYKKLIIEQQIIVETMLDSINNYLGSIVKKGKEKSLQLIDSIKNIKELAILFKNILLDPNLMNEAIENVTKAINEQINKFKSLIDNILKKISAKLIGFTDKLENFLNNVLENSKEFINNKGWVGFIMGLGLAVLLTWVNKNWLENLGGVLFDTINDQLKNIESVIDIFNSLKNLSSYVAKSIGVENILEWFISFGTGTKLIGVVFTASEIIQIIYKILVPTVIGIKTKFNLNKT